MLEDITTCNFVTVIVEIVMTDNICLLFILWCCFLFFIIWFGFPVLPLSIIFAAPNLQLINLHIFSSHLYFPPTFHFYGRLFFNYITRTIFHSFLHVRTYSPIQLPPKKMDPRYRFQSIESEKKEVNSIPEKRRIDLILRDLKIKNSFLAIIYFSRSNYFTFYTFFSQPLVGVVTSVNRTHNRIAHTSAQSSQRSSSSTASHSLNSTSNNASSQSSHLPPSISISIPIHSSSSPSSPSSSSPSPSHVSSPSNSPFHSPHTSTHNSPLRIRKGIAENRNDNGKQHRLYNIRWHFNDIFMSTWEYILLSRNNNYLFWKFTITIKSQYTKPTNISCFVTLPVHI